MQNNICSLRAISEQEIVFRDPDFLSCAKVQFTRDYTG